MKKSLPKVTKVTGAKAAKSAKSKTPLIEVSLAEVPSEPASEIGDYALWFYGSPKIGKTTLASMFPHAHFFMFEPGGRALRIHQKSIAKWQEFGAYIDLLNKGGHPFRTAVVDVVEKAHAMCFKYMCKKLVISHPADVEDYGKSWGKIMEEFLDKMGGIASIPNMGTIFISHAAMTKRKTRTGEEIQDIHPSLTGKPLEALEGAMDLIGYIHFRRGQRVMQIQGSDTIMAGCRLEENFRHTDGSQIVYIPLGNSKSEAFDNFMAAYNNELPPPPKETGPKKLAVKKKK